MFLMIIRKMWNKKSMIAFLFIGNLLFIGIAAVNPIFLNATFKRTLYTSITSLEEEQGQWPMLYSVTPASTYKPQMLQRTSKELLSSADDFELPLYELITFYSQKTDETVSSLAREDRTSSLQVSTITGLGDHIEILSGTPMSSSPDEEDVIDAVVSQRAFRKCEFILGEVLTFESLELRPGVPLKIRVSGIFKNNQENDAYWINSPNSYTQNLFINDSLYASLYLSDNSAVKSKAAWYALYDYSNLHLDSIPAVLTQISRYDELFQSEYGTNHTCSFTDIYKHYLVTKRNTEIIFRILQIPFFLLLLSFILMVSRQLLSMELSEIAIYASRGVSRKQIFTMYLIQSLFITFSASILAIPFSWFLVNLLGSASGFLTFSKDNTLYPDFPFQVLLYMLVSCILSISIMLLPVIRQSKTTVVQRRTEKYRKRRSFIWQKYCLDFILLGISFYGLFNFSNQKDVILSRIISGKTLDPLPFLCSSLFLFGCGLLMFHLTTYIIRFVFFLFKKFWSPSLYSSFAYLTKTRKQQMYFTVFLFLTIALGIFNSVAARTINNNDEQNTRYLTGADLVLQERWQSNSDSLDVQENNGVLIYQEPDFSKYTELNHVESIAKVYRTDGMTVNLPSGNLKNVALMGIQSKDFGETAYFDSSLLPQHWYNYLNLLAKNPTGVLVSSALADEYHVKKGDDILIKNTDGVYLRGTVLDFVSYWPGYASSYYELQSDGRLKEEQQHLIVANLSAVQNAFGILPYEIWFKTNGNNTTVCQEISALGIPVLSITDTEKLLQNRKNDALINSTNGILTLGFLISIILCAAGFLIYWTLSIKERELQFGIFRAMGMTLCEIIEMLINEQLFLSLLPILTGIFFGCLAAKLYMPIIQMIYSSADYVIPLKVIFSTKDNLKLTILLIFIFGLCMSILIHITQKMKIAQALKLGED